MAEQDLFQISHIVPDFEAQFAEYKVASDRTRRTLRSQLDVPYGPAPRICAIVEYTLKPAVPMSNLVRETREALAWLAAHAGELGGDGTKLSASGHSAGGHLVTYLASRAPHERAFPAMPVRSIIPISGIYDLRPITTSYLQPEVQLTDEEVAQWSPIEAVPSTGTHYEIVVGHDETAPFHQQAQDYAYVLERHGVSHERVTLHGEEHMSVVRKLGIVGSPMWELLRDAIERSRG